MKNTNNNNVKNGSNNNVKNTKNSKNCGGKCSSPKDCK